ncbi:PIN domain-containing protein [Candidatus Woesearchaeota archaeon]|nr:PIN domain-containing protein [Candidatus Woesearchaeota archaeon]
MVEYFFDTYALIEIVKGNPAYGGFAAAKAYTTLLNLYELYVQILKDYGEELAKKEFEFFKRILIEIEDKHIFSAASFKIKDKKTHFSYTDALGYSIAGAKSLKFVTGDNEFRNLPNVQFVR